MIEAFTLKALLFFTIILQTNSCIIPDVQIQCAEYWLESHNEIVILCEAEYNSNEYEALFNYKREKWNLWQMWENGGPYFGEEKGLWNNIYKEAITGTKKADHCNLPKLNENRHD